MVHLEQMAWNIKVAQTSPMLCLVSLICCLVCVLRYSTLFLRIWLAFEFNLQATK